MNLKACLAECLQRGLSLTERPYLALAFELGCEESIVLDLTRELIHEQYIRSFGAFVDYERLGYEGLLCGISVPDERVASVAALLHKRHEVTHNYLRDHEVNLWFTALLRDDDERKRFFTEVLDPSECSFVVLTTEARLKLWPTFRFVPREFDELDTVENQTISPQDTPPEAFLTLDEESMRTLALLQRDFPIVSEPFELAARKLGRSVPQLLKLLRELEKSRVLRRIGASLHHRRVGYNANALVAWSINDEDIPQAGETASEFPWVSHCYVRRVLESTLSFDWPYVLYTMLHAPDDETLSERIHLMRKSLEYPNAVILTTLRELKKTRRLLDA